jgi:hypothetical protein
MWKNETFYNKSTNFRYTIRGRNGYWIDVKAYLNANDKTTYVGSISKNSCYTQTKYFNDIKFNFKSLQAARNWCWKQRCRIYRSQK